MRVKSDRSINQCPYTLNLQFLRYIDFKSWIRYINSLQISILGVKNAEIYNPRIFRENRLE